MQDKDDALLIRVTPIKSPISETVEVVRSFSYKLNMGNDEHGRPSYESADFFCSHKAQCALEDRDEVGRDLDAFCMEQVLDSIKEFKARRAAKQAQRRTA
jgi:hypothetical protein